MDECIDSLGDVTMLSTLYANSSYWQVKIDDRDQENVLYKLP